LPACPLSADPLSRPREARCIGPSNRRRFSGGNQWLLIGLGGGGAAGVNHLIVAVASLGGNTTAAKVP
jgi:hypothetical protein